MGVEFHVLNRKKDGYYKITVIGKNGGSDWLRVKMPKGIFSIKCDCDAWKTAKKRYCRHIDAVLLYRQLSVVRREDIPLAMRAIDAVGNGVVRPRRWKGDWKDNIEWLKGEEKIGSPSSMVDDRHMTF